MPGTAQQRSLTSFFSLKTSSSPPNAAKKKTSDPEAPSDSMSSSSKSSGGNNKGLGSKRASNSNSEADGSPKRTKIEDKAAGASVSPPIKEPGWANALAAETSKPYFRKLEAFLNGAYASNKGAVYPPREKLFNAFESCPLDSVKVVILGQDPYHQRGQAHGLAFSVMPGVTQPPSLRNMIKEAVSCCGIRQTKSGTLDMWCKQGVLLLNTVLSVQDSKPNSHRKQGWETFTDAVVRELNKGNRRLVFMLWGKPSQKKGAIIDASKHKVLSCNHPSPLSATKGPVPFMGFACFKKANEALTELGHGAVDWNVE